MLCLGRGKQSLHFFLTEALLLREKCAGKKSIWRCISQSGSLVENSFECLSLTFLSNPVFYKTGKIFPFPAVSQLVLTNIKLKQSEESSKKLAPNV